MLSLLYCAVPSPTSPFFVSDLVLMILTWKNIYEPAHPSYTRITRYLHQYLCIDVICITCATKMYSVTRGCSRWQACSERAENEIPTENCDEENVKTNDESAPVCRQLTIYLLQAHLVSFEESNEIHTCWNFSATTRAGPEKNSSINQQPALIATIVEDKNLWRMLLIIGNVLQKKLIHFVPRFVILL